MPNCVYCDKPVPPDDKGKGRVTKFFRLDGSVRQGMMHGSCYKQEFISVPEYSVCKECGYDDSYIRKVTFELPHNTQFHEAEGYMMKCPEHGTESDTLAFMLWWARYRAEHYREEAQSGEVHPLQ